MESSKQSKHSSEKNTAFPEVGQALLEKAKHIYYYSPGLFIPSKKQGIEAVGNSLFLRYMQHHFLVTAAHVVKSFKMDNLAIVFENKILPLAGQNFTTNRISTIDDKIDVAVVLLNDNFMNQLPGQFKFFDLSDIDLDARDSSKMEYLVVGTPVSKVRLNPVKGKIEMAPFIFLTDIAQKKKLSYHTKTRNDANLLFNYRKRRIQDPITGSLQQGPNLEGLSGCAIWKLSDLKNIELANFYPAAILIEHYKDHGAIVGTRIQIIVELIRIVFRLDLPKNKRFTINAINSI